MLIRLGIKVSIDWEKIGMNVIADVGNGQEGKTMKALVKNTGSLVFGWE